MTLTRVAMIASVLALILSLTSMLAAIRQHERLKSDLERARLLDEVPEGAAEFYRNGVRCYTVPGGKGKNGGGDGGSATICGRGGLAVGGRGGDGHAPSLDASGNPR